jgi:hypothetical protein
MYDYQFGVENDGSSCALLQMRSGRRTPRVMCCFVSASNNSGSVKETC